MKKQLLIAVLAFSFGTASAQLTSKKGETILPEQGDWSLGVDATPFLDYVGNFLSSGGNSAPTQEFLNTNQTIIGKYFKTDKMAYRGILRIGMNSSTMSANIGQHGVAAPTYPALPAIVEDKYTEKRTFVGIGGGMEWRRGSTRLQGYYGGDLMITFSNSGRTFEYGNALNDSTAVSSITTDWYDADENSYNMGFDTYGNSARYNTVKDGSVFGLTVRGFAGVEYFIFPKISLAGEFGWGVTFASMGASTVELESVGNNGTDNVVGTQTIESTKGSRFGLDTDRNLTGTATGVLRLNFHF
jgi:hypothetical protein